MRKMFVFSLILFNGVVLFASDDSSQDYANWHPDTPRIADDLLGRSGGDSLDILRNRVTGIQNMVFTNDLMVRSQQKAIDENRETASSNEERIAGLEQNGCNAEQIDRLQRVVTGNAERIDRLQRVVTGILSKVRRRPNLKPTEDGFWDFLEGRRGPRLGAFLRRTEGDRTRQSRQGSRTRQSRKRKR